MYTTGLIMAAFGARPGAGRRSRNSFVEHLPPLVSGRHCLQIDPTPLVLHGKLFMDQHAFDLVTRSSYSKAKDLAHLLVDLYEDGFLETRSFSTFTEVERCELAEFIRFQLRSKRRLWLKEIRSAIIEWETANPQYAKSYGRRYSADLQVPYVIGAVLDEMNEPNLFRAGEVRRAIFSDETPSDREMTDTSITSILSHTYSNKLQTLKIGAPVYDWDNMSRFLTFEDREKAAYQTRLKEAADFVIFDMANIDASSITPSNLRALLKDKQLSELRGYIEAAAAEGSVHLQRDKEAFYRLLLNHEVRVDDCPRRIFTRIAVAALKTSLTIADSVASGAAGFALKTLEEYLKDEAEKIATASLVQPPVLPAAKAVYVLTRHLNRRK